MTANTNPTRDLYELQAIDAICTPPNNYTMYREWELTEPYGPPSWADEQPQEPKKPTTPAESLLPWQGGALVSETSRKWSLYLTSGGAQADTLARVDLYHHERTGRYEWVIVGNEGFTPLAASRGPGWLYYDRAERAALMALAAILHPASNLPASLPPQTRTFRTLQKGSAT